MLNSFFRAHFIPFPESIIIISQIFIFIKLFSEIILIFTEILCIIEPIQKRRFISMKSVKISLQMAQNVKEFVKIVQDYPYEIDLKSDKYVVDAKSILGIFSLDLSKPLVVEIHADDCQDLIDELKKFA
jgi:hypothetical protein